MFLGYNLRVEILLSIRVYLYVCLSLSVSGCLSVYVTLLYSSFCLFHLTYLFNLLIVNSGCKGDVSPHNLRGCDSVILEGVFPSFCISACISMSLSFSASIYFSLCFSLCFSLSITHFHLPVQLACSEPQR
jgi:hypothetical protein